MSTLKIGWEEPRQGCAEYPAHWVQRSRWFSDVEAIEKLDGRVYTTFGQVRERHGMGIHTFAWLWDGEPDEMARGPFGGDDVRSIALTLLLVTTKGKSEADMILVDKAWLLGPDGQTIDRVAP